LDLESPRVKNVPLKAYFCLPYFVIIYVQLADTIWREEERLEQALFTEGDHKQISPVNSPPKLLESVEVSSISFPRKKGKKKVVRQLSKPHTPIAVHSDARYLMNTISFSNKKSTANKRCESRSSSVASTKKSVTT